MTRATDSTPLSLSKLLTSADDGVQTFLKAKNLAADHLVAFADAIASRAGTDWEGLVSMPVGEVDRHIGMELLDIGLDAFFLSGFIRNDGNGSEFDSRFVRNEMAELVRRAEGLA